MTLEIEPFRDPTRVERAAVAFLLSREVSGVEAMRNQADAMQVAINCTCGCGSLSILPSPSAPDFPADGPELPSAFNRDDAVEIALLGRGGRLTGLEVTHFAGASQGIPAIESFELFDAELTEIDRAPAPSSPPRHGLRLWGRPFSRRQ